MSQDRGYVTEILHRRASIHLETPVYGNRYDISVSHHAKENINGSYYRVRVSAQIEENGPSLKSLITSNET